MKRGSITPIKKFVALTTAWCVRPDCSPLELPQNYILDFAFAYDFFVHPVPETPDWRSTPLYSVVCIYFPRYRVAFMLLIRRKTITFLDFALCGVLIKLCRVCGESISSEDGRRDGCGDNPGCVGKRGLDLAHGYVNDVLRL